MTRMAEPERPRDEHDYDDERFEDEGRRSIFSALWFRAILVVIVLGVVVAVAVPYVLELANQPAPKTAALGKPETTPTPAPIAPPAPPPVASVPAPSASAPEKAPAPEKPASAERSAASDRYDVHVSGAAPAELNAKLSAKGLSAEPSGGGVVVKPSMPLRDAVALSKDLAVDGLKVQVRRAAVGSAPAPAAAPSAPTAMSDGTVYRVRVGPFDDKTTATSTLRELEQRGYSPFIARGGQ